MNDQMWIELVDGIVVAKLRGPLSAALLERCQARVLELHGPAARSPVLYDASELRAPENPFEPPDLSRLPIAAKRVRGAIVLSDGRLRNHLREAFGGSYGECRIFDSDLDAAYSWVCAKMTAFSAPPAG